MSWKAAIPILHHSPPHLLPAPIHGSRTAALPSASSHCLNVNKLPHGRRRSYFDHINYFRRSRIASLFPYFSLCLSTGEVAGSSPLKMLLRTPQLCGIIAFYIYGCSTTCGSVHRIGGVVSEHLEEDQFSPTSS